jgi:hypothetical protein
MSGVRGTSVIGATAADAPPTSEKVNPAAPNTGTDFVTRFRFEACFTCGIVASSNTLEKIFRVQPINCTLWKCSMQGWSGKLTCRGRIEFLNICS